MTTTPSQSTAKQACGQHSCAYNSGNKKARKGGLLLTVTKAAAIALMTLNPPRAGESSNEIIM